MNLRTLAVAAILAVPGAALADHTYQVTGPVVSSNADSITVEKGSENWEIARGDDKTEGRREGHHHLHDDGEEGGGEAGLGQHDEGEVGARRARGRSALPPLPGDARGRAHWRAVDQALTSGL